MGAAAAQGDFVFLAGIVISLDRLGFLGPGWGSCCGGVHAVVGRGGIVKVCLARVVCFDIFFWIRYYVDSGGLHGIGSENIS